VEADDDGLYVLKFRGAGQGKKALTAELLGGEIARALGLLVPELVLTDLDPKLGRSEPDPEIQALIQESGGLNLALDYLPGALAFDPILNQPEPELASAIVWLDALITNVDRTPRNVNMLTWHNRIWLIDHGASFYFHHAWQGYQERARRPFVQIREHVLLPFATKLHVVDEWLTGKLGEEVLRGIVELLPDDWLDDKLFDSPEQERAAYLSYLHERLAPPRVWVEEAIHAHEELL
jgi:hypothetical protein